LEKKEKGGKKMKDSKGGGKEPLGGRFDLLGFDGFKRDRLEVLCGKAVVKNGEVRKTYPKERKQKYSRRTRGGGEQPSRMLENRNQEEKRGKKGGERVLCGKHRKNRQGGRRAPTI